MFALWWSQQPRTSVAASAIVSVFSGRETETASVCANGMAGILLLIINIILIVKLIELIN